MIYAKCRNCDKVPNEMTIKQQLGFQVLSGFCDHKCRNEFYKYKRTGMKK
jgi:hypothetical protein